MTVIAFDSDPGSEGDLIAATVATRLGLTIVDHACLFKRLKRHGVDMPAAFLDGEADGCAQASTLPWRTVGTKLQLELLRLAQQDQILLHWPCAPYLLADVGHIPRIKVRAPLSMRVRRYAARCGCDEQEARRRILQHEGNTRFILSACFGIDAPMDAETYTLVADTGWLTAADWADEIVELAGDGEFAPTATSQAMLRWLLLQLPQEPNAPICHDRDAASSC